MPSKSPPSAVPEPPKVVGVEIVAAQPNKIDYAIIARISASENRTPAELTYLVKLKLQYIPEPTAHGWSLYVGDLRVPQYGPYTSGIYFTVYDPQFFRKFQGQAIRFSQDGQEFFDTGFRLKPAPAVPARLPAQETVLSQ